MDIKLTHTGVIPLDDYNDYQYFLVISRKDKIPWLVYKCSSELRDSLGFTHKYKEKFVAWEPVNLGHDFNPCELKKLWLISLIFTNPSVGFSRILSSPTKNSAASSGTEASLTVFTRKETVSSWPVIFLGLKSL